MAASVPISHDRLLEIVDYDPDTGIFVWRYRPGHKRGFNARFAGSSAGYTGLDGYVSIRLDGRLYKASRIAVFYVTSKWPSAEVDHKNRNPSDNRFDNLREASRAQNEMNKTSSPKRSSSRFRGVHLHLPGRWRARLRSEHIGIFGNEEDAARACDAVAYEQYGEFVALNFPLRECVP